jgi:hypothetical protein
MKARTADPEKTSTAIQEHGKHVSMVMNNHTTTGPLLESMFSMWYIQRLYKENLLEFSVCRMLQTVE